MAKVDIAIPTYKRPLALGITLASLVGQTFSDFRVVISDQDEENDLSQLAEIGAIFRVLRAHQVQVDYFKHLPRRGMAEQRQFLLDHAAAPYVLYLDDDLILEPFVVEQLVKVIDENHCGFAGSAVTGLSYERDHRPQQEAIEFWEGPVEPEEIRPGGPKWERARLHNAANLWHVQQRLGLCFDQTRLYHVAWIGGCVLFDTQKLIDVGAFEFWENLPIDHSGEDVLVQIRVMRKYGGCGVVPSGVYHQELPTTVPDRRVDAPFVINPFLEEMD